MSCVVCAVSTCEKTIKMPLRSGVNSHQNASFRRWIYSSLTRLPWVLPSLLVIGRRRDDIGVYSRRRAVPCHVDGATSDAAKPAALTARGEAGANRIRAHHGHQLSILRRAHRFAIRRGGGGEMILLIE